MKIFFLAITLVLATLKLEASTPARPIINIAVLGSIGVGKSTLIEKFTDRLLLEDINSEQNKTPEFTFHKSEDPKAIFKIWEFTGSEKLSHMNILYTRDIDACIVIYDPENQDTYDKIMAEFQELFGDELPALLIANYKNKLTNNKILDYIDNTNDRFYSVEHLSIIGENKKKIVEVFSRMYRQVIGSEEYIEKIRVRSESFYLEETYITSYKDPSSCCFSKGKELKDDDSEMSTLDFTKTMNFSSTIN